ncbi:BrxA/BrxB family bacilliredoxin [Mammaliicoccus sciuri]|uniref:BrxA/BrxB family bacilliredoxin n=1 Tax=Mammaliicoccus sciuri TaxID=1296 RepID=UPI00066A3B04|nr:BrxA/BrxB family bacilliredoxin [Mammaliicoccus sciuri]MCD3220648.1 BrxA/BrxB family bacilliredoxin [Mammaliicoccus sciuri]MCD8810297.1 BrxA/BrxB family bacilliredoxin [Mammaliicoccus sciuri]MCD8894837.1 BrxA/BrxB family bacilliredoxin [Mammaliicoccus sciuri]MCD8913026.1 BrxA/BrxB family bacilliredoxin [Mammaliicoccus sciuri]MCJ0908831.1 BrxA/BrxB family bacilliredoxin [Mammaliicoccus sciuri]
MNAYEQYMKELAQPMRSELTGQGFESLESAESVKEYMENAQPNDTTFIVVNSVCGCAAGLARPAAVTVAQQNDKKPSRIATVFAGQDKEATETMREYIAQVPSSPSMALFKGNELKYFMPREHIEGRDIQEICLDIKDAFDEYCD